MGALVTSRKDGSESYTVRPDRVEPRTVLWFRTTASNAPTARPSRPAGSQNFDSVSFPPL